MAETQNSVQVLLQGAARRVLLQAKAQWRCRQGAVLLQGAAAGRDSEFHKFLLRDAVSRASELRRVAAAGRGCTGCGCRVLMCCNVLLQGLLRPSLRVAGFCCRGGAVARDFNFSCWPNLFGETGMSWGQVPLAAS